MNHIVTLFLGLLASFSGLVHHTLGTTITTINGSDTITNSRAVINTNFSNLNSSIVGTTSGLVAGQVLYATGVNTMAGVATSTLTFTGPFSGLSTLGALVGGSASTIAYSGLATTSQPSSSNILTSNGAAGVYGTATTSVTTSAGLTVKSGTLGALVGGAASTLGQIENRSWSYATSTAWVGTTTIPLGVGYGETWNNVKCYTDAGTLNLDFYYSSTHMLNPVTMNASTTIGTISAFSNATPTTGNPLKVDVGTPASSPTKISCTTNDTN